jgi:hypothetical protein
MMKVINIDEECHGHIGIATNVETAVDFLIKKGWLYGYSEIYTDSDEWKSLEAVFGSEWEKEIHSWTLDHFNDVFEGCFYLREECLYDGTNEDRDE